MSITARRLTGCLGAEVSGVDVCNPLSAGEVDAIRALLLDPATQQLTPRGQSIINHTPMGRFGDPEDLLGAVLWLLSPASAFVTGTVVPIDGGFAAFAGV